MLLPSRRRSGISLFILVVAGCALVAGVIYYLTAHGTSSESAATVLLHKVQRSDFEAFVTEPGEVVSSSNVDVRCQVETRGSAGTAIVRICDEGTQVQPGDFLFQLDDSALQHELIAQKIVVANDKAMMIQADSNLANAERTLKEFEAGLYEQECEKLQSAIYVAEEEQRKNELELASNRRLAARGLINALQVTAAEFSLEKTRKDVAAANRALDVYQRFTREKMVGEYQAEIEKQKANVEAATFTLELSKQKLTDIEQQIAHCLVTAPCAGQVVHANERDRGEPMVMEEGSYIRYNQVVVRLPDIRQMQVDTKVNESHINRIVEGQPARIELDADPDRVLTGKVIAVAPYPFPMRWHGSPLEYGVEVAIIDPPPTIRPGLRAKVKILFDSQSDALQVPLSAVIAHEKIHYCLVQDKDSWRVQPVDIGPSNNNLVVVHHGLTAGDQVALTPFRFIQRSDLPAAPPAPVVSNGAQNNKKLDVVDVATSPAVPDS